MTPETEGLLNQWARDAGGRILHVSQCSPSAHYTCPMGDCGAALSLVAVDSDKVRRHLRHEVACRTAESVEHYVAKHLAAQRLRAWLSGEAPPPYVTVRCACGAERDIHQPFAGAARVTVEGSIGRRRADVLVSSDARPLCALEVLVSHEVDEAKAADLAATGVPWVEIDAAVILSRKVWRAYRSSGEPEPCSRCERQRRRNDLARLAQVQGSVAEAERQLAIARTVQAEAAQRLRAAEEAQATAARLERGTLPALEQARLRQTAIAADLAALSPAGPDDTASVPPTWHLPPLRFAALAAEAERAEAAKAPAPAYGARCPRCDVQKVVPRKPRHCWPERLFCNACGHVFVAEVRVKVALDEPDR